MKQSVAQSSGGSGGRHPPTASSDSVSYPPLGLVMSPNDGPAVPPSSASSYAVRTSTSAPQLCPTCSQPDGLLACDICSGNFHANCLDMKDSVAAVLLSIIDTTGWVCYECRRMSKQHFNCLRSGQAKLAEEVAQLKTAVLELQDRKQGSSEGLATLKTTQKLDVVAAVHLDMAEKQRRSKNVVVTGLKPVDGCEDAKLFLDLCEDNLSVKPYINRCYRLGRQQEQRVQPLLIQLDSEDSAAELLRSSRELRRIDSCKGIYINRDLTPAEAEAAYLLRQKRRERRDRLQAASEAACMGSTTVCPSDNMDGSVDSV